MKIKKTANEDESDKQGARDMQEIHLFLHLSST